MISLKPSTMMSDDEIISLVEGSIRHFYAEDAWLLENNLSERSIAHKLAECIQIRIKGYKVDCEYNGAMSNYYSKKKIHILTDELRAYGLLRETDEIDEEEDFVERSVFPDIIVHKRGDNSHNVCVVEIKKNTSRVSPEYDRLKLKAYTSKKLGNTLCYKLGIFLVFETGETRKHSMTFFRNGEAIPYDER
jgi:hypothetical protein